MLKERVITAIVLFVILLGAYFISPVALSAVMALGFTLALWEWLKLAKIASKPAAVVATVVGMGMCSLIWLIYQEIQTGSYAASAVMADASSLFINYITLVTLLWLGISIRVFFARHSGMKVSLMLVALSGVIFVPAAWISFVGMYAAFGISMILSLLCIVWVADIMAYFAGRAFGKHKMATAISPKKSWEGVAGGMASVILLGWAAAEFLPQYDTIPGVIIESMGLAAWVGVAFVLVTLSIVGDLYESALKRQVDIKDSSNLLPGHGGFYDRTDALMPTLPAGLLLTILVLSSQGF